MTLDCNLSSIRRQAIIRTTADRWSIMPLQTIPVKFELKYNKCHWRKLFEKWVVSNVLMYLCIEMCLFVYTCT